MGEHSNRWAMGRVVSVAACTPAVATGPSDTIAAQAKSERMLASDRCNLADPLVQAKEQLEADDTSYSDCLPAAALEQLDSFVSSDAAQASPVERRARRSLAGRPFDAAMDDGPSFASGLAPSRSG